MPKAIPSLGNQVQLTIPLTDLEHLTASQRRDFGKAIIREIKKRTAAGIDADGKAFKGYSKDYKDSQEFKAFGKSSGVNLKLSGDMLSSLTVKEVNFGSITIGFDDPEEEAKAHGNISGSYGQSFGNPSKARNFVGLSESALEEVKKPFLNLKPEETIGEQRSLLSAVGTAFFDRLTGSIFGDG